MPDRRLILPLDCTGANPATVPGGSRVALADLGGAPLPVREAVADPEVPVLFVLPSLVHVLQAGWVGALGAGAWTTFGTWVEGALSEGAQPSALPTWRYDEVLTAWADVVGPARIRVVLGEEHADAAPGSGTRALSWAEIGMIETLVAELVTLGLVGRNAAELVHGGVTRLVRTESIVPLGVSPLPQALEARIAETAAAMVVALDASGVHVIGDRSLLGWPPRSGRTAAANSGVGLVEAARLATGVLEQVATWGPKASS